VADIGEILVHWDAGEPISTIAQTLGYSRPTVRKYVTAAQGIGLERGGHRRRDPDWHTLARQVLETVKGRRPVGAVTQEVAAFHDYLAERVGKVKLRVLHQRLRDGHGLTASWGAFYRYVRAHWVDRLPRTPAVTVRLDDPPPGEEAQVDFFYVGLWEDPEAGRQRKLYAFLMTLSHSRHQFLYPVLAEDSDAWLSGHVAAFAFFGGVPRRIVPDNLTAGIVKADRYDPRFNRAYAELARWYDCLIDPSRVQRPKDKARVERTVAYARASFFADRPGRTLGELRREAVIWARDVAGTRDHGTTHEPPLAAFEAREREKLLPLPARAWEAVRWLTAKVHPDCHLSAEGGRYSVPYRYVGKQLDVRLSRTTVEIYAGAELVTIHAFAGRGRATLHEHYPEAAQAFLRATPQYCLRQAEAIGPETTAVVQALLTPHALYRLREVQAILRLAERFTPERLDHACRQAREGGDGRLRTIRGLLERGLEDDPREPIPFPVPNRLLGAYLRGPAAFLPAEGQA
jgi:transposase